jgi:hypothetical protein
MDTANGAALRARSLLALAAAAAGRPARWPSRDVYAIIAFMPASPRPVGRACLFARPCMCLSGQRSIICRPIDHTFTHIPISVIKLPLICPVRFAEI